MSKLILPVTRYYGSKRKLISKIWDELELLELQFDSTIDIFGGSGIFSYYSKRHNKKVIYNDIFKFNSIIGKALIENKKNELSKDEALLLLKPIKGYKYEDIIERNYKDIYYTDEENKKIDIVIQNIEMLDSETKKYSAYYLLFQSCLIKRPFNIFHRKNLNLRLNFKSAKFGNKVTWEKTFEELFVKFNAELDRLVFDNNQSNKSLNISALSCSEKADLVYIDPPYFADKGSHVSYFSRYHFLEGLAHYSEIEDHLTGKKINKEIFINNSTEFENKDNFIADLDKLVSNYRKSIIVISYRNNGVPSIREIHDIVAKYKSNCKTITLGNYGYALNKNNAKNSEFIVVGY